jgi:hypothetical protein
VRTFLPMETEIARVAGFHTGVSLHIDSDFIDDEAVKLHERIHELIFAETPDGIFHSLLLRLLQKSEEPQTIQLLERVTTQLLEDSRFAHEVAATFLGTQALRSDAERVDLIATLPHEYKTYYSFFDGLISDLFTCSFARYAVAWAFSRWAFCSPRAEIIMELSDLRNEHVWRRIPGPNERIQRLRENISTFSKDQLRETIVNVARVALERSGVEWFDIEREDLWIESAATSRGQRADSAVIRACEEIAQSIGKLPTIRAFRPAPFFEEASIFPDARWYTHDTFAEGQAPSLDVIRHIARQADARFIGRALPRIPQVAPASVETIVGWACRENGRICCVARREQGEVRYTAFVSVVTPAGRSFPPMGFMQFDLAGLQTLVRAVAQSGTVVPVFLVFGASEWVGADAVPFPVDDLLPSARMGRIIELFSAPPEITTFYLVAYVRDAWSLVLNHVTGTLLNCEVRLVNSDDGVSKQFHLDLLAQPESPSTYAAMMAPSDHDDYQLLVDHAIEQGRIAMGEGDGDFPPAKLDELILALWNSFERL